MNGFSPFVVQTPPENASTSARSSMSRLLESIIIIAGLFCCQDAMAAVDDTILGDLDTDYRQIEFAPDGSFYLAWNDKTSGTSSVWLARMDPRTGSMIPPDGRGLMVVDDSVDAGVVQWGIDIDGLFCAFPRRADGLLSICRINENGGVDVSVLAAPARMGRYALYASTDTTRPGWISYLQESDGQVYAVSLQDPLVEYNLTGNQPIGEVGPRWVPGQPIMIAGIEEDEGRIQLWQIDFSSGVPGPLQRITHDENDYRGAFPFVVERGNRAILAVLNRTEDIALLLAPIGNELDHRLVAVYETRSEFKSPRAFSPEPMKWNGHWWAMYSVFDARLPGPYANIGEIYLADLHRPKRPPIRLTEDTLELRTEPEPLNGTSWGYYSGRGILEDVFHFHRLDLGPLLDSH